MSKYALSRQYDNGSEVFDTYVGPFDTYEQAVAYAVKNGFESDDTAVVILQSPDDQYECPPGCG